MVYEQDIEDIREMMAPHSISPYEGSDAQHDFDNSMVVKEGSKIKRSHDNYNVAGPNGEGISNDVPLKEDSKIKGCLAHCSSGSLPIILLQGTFNHRLSFLLSLFCFNFAFKIYFSAALDI